MSPQEAPGEFVSFGVFADGYEQGGQVLGLQDFSLQTLLQQPELIIKKSLTIKHWELQIQFANYVSWRHMQTIHNWSNRVEQSAFNTEFVSSIQPLIHTYCCTYCHEWNKNTGNIYSRFCSAVAVYRLGKYTCTKEAILWCKPTTGACESVGCRRGQLWWCFSLRGRWTEGTSPGGSPSQPHCELPLCTPLNSHR